MIQEVETALRRIVGQSEHSGPISQFERLRGERNKLLTKKGMGHLVERFGDDVLTSHEAADPDAAEPATLDEPHLTVRSRVQMEPDQLRNRRRSLRHVVTANKLVHRLLVGWQQDSAESCRELLQRLEAQHQSFSTELKTLRAHAEALKTGEQILQSADAKRVLGEMLEDSGKFASDPDQSARPRVEVAVTCPNCPSTPSPC